MFLSAAAIAWKRALLGRLTAVLDFLQIFSTPCLSADPQSQLRAALPP